MPKVTEHIARKDRSCDEYPRCTYGIRKGERYRRYVAFPGDEGHEEGTRPWVLTVCAGCAGQSNRPMTGARVEVFRLNRGNVEVVATGVITKTILGLRAVQGYEVTDDDGVVHEADVHKINTLEAIAS